MQFRRKHTEKAQPQIARFAGKGYREGWKVAVDAYENHPFELVVNLLPVLAYKNPSVIVKPRSAFGNPAEAVALQMVLRQWVADVQFARVVRDALYDFCFCFGVLGVGLEGVPGHEMESPAPMRPTLRHIPPGRFFADPEAMKFSDTAFAGNVWVRNVEDLKQATNPDGSPVFDAKALEDLASDDGMAEDARDTGREDIFDGLEVRKGQMVGYEVWCRSNNMIYTLAFKRGGRKEGQFIRDPRVWAGSADQGPYHLLGAYTVPGQLYPLSPLQVTADLVDEINAHAGMLRRQAGTAKRIIVADSTQTADKVTASPDGSVITIPGLNKVETVEFEGPNPANVEYLAMLRERLDRQSGISDMVRGNATGDPTATEAQLAAQYHNGRVRFLQSIVQEACVGMLENVAAVMYGSEEIAIPVQQDGMTGVFAGGQWPGSGSRESLAVSIEPYSMEWSNEGLRQRQMAETMKAVYEVAPLMPSLPWVKHQGVWNDILETINVPNGFARYFDPAALQLGMQISAVQSVQGVRQAAAEHDATKAKADSARNPPPKPGGGKSIPKGTMRSEAGVRAHQSK